jgi:hypothetical protein
MLALEASRSPARETTRQASHLVLVVLLLAATLALTVYAVLR